MKMNMKMTTINEVPSVVASSLVVIVMSSRSVKLHWTLAYPVEREIIDGFFIGYKSATANGSPAQMPLAAPFDQVQNPDQQLAQQQMTGGDLPTYTYKNVRLNRGSGEQLDPSAVYISPLTSITKTISQPQQQQQQQVVSSTFEFVIGGLERNTEYSVIIQCFNKKGVGPASDTETFRTFANGESHHIISFSITRPDTN